MTATDELRRMLDERGVEHTDAEDGHTQHTFWLGGDHEIAACNSGKRLAVYNLTPEQAIAATLGRGTCRKVYLVETSDDLLESWYPIAVYLHRESAEDCAEALRKEEGGIRQFARVSELRVVDG